MKHSHFTVSALFCTLLLCLILSGCYFNAPAPKESIFNNEELAAPLPSIIASPSTTLTLQITPAPSTLKTSVPSPSPTPTSLATLNQTRLAVEADIIIMLKNFINKNQDADLPIQTEFIKLVDQLAPFSDMELQDLRDRITGAATTYKHYFYEDALSALKAANSFKSTKRKQYEDHLLKLNAITTETIKYNDSLITKIAAKQAIPYTNNENIVIDEDIIQVLISNQEMIGQRLDKLFNDTKAALAAKTAVAVDTTSTPLESSPSSSQSPAMTAISLGSTTEEVEQIMGKPSAMQNYRFTKDDWKYGASSIRFDANGKVIGWINSNHTLKVNLGSPLSNAKPFTKGSTRVQVSAVMGTPDALNDFGAKGSSWVYGESRVDFTVEGNVKGWVNTSENLIFTR